MNVYQIITERIIKSLEQGIIPWRRPWRVAGPPCNFISTKPYRGINVLLLATQGYGSAYWLTYKQATERGGHVKKGEKSTPIVFWQVGEKEKASTDGEGQKVERMFLLRYYNVFNLEQTTLAPTDNSRPVIEPIAACSAVVDGWSGKPRMVLDDPKVSQAEYFPKLDAIAMPLMSRFLSAENYYATLFHEMIHSTGHASRLARPGIIEFDRFGSQQYSREELIAEIGSAFLCGHAGISKPEIQENTTAYLQNWIAELKGDSRLIVSAAAQAQHAADMVLGTCIAEQEPPQTSEAAVMLSETKDKELCA
ncbi:MAG TPA: ArdC-like ssDNA-binding domain-containing protein [Verrucomicrobiae bacterium]|jgi:antirestriction protein ArdC|nr:ArdC-like ssDNA-binding domain-containing protein [Verrucomicrobiae bacterium]